MAKLSKIEAEIIKLKAQIEKLQDSIYLLRKKCSHNPKYITEKYDSNTGNYDPYSDCYWVQRDCTNCGKHWTIDSKEDGYRSVIPFDKQVRSENGIYTYKVK